MAASSSSPQALRACLQEAAQQGRAMLQRCIGRIEGSLEERVQRAHRQDDRRVLHDAIGLLSRHAAGLAERFSEALQAEFAAPAAVQARRPATGLKFAELELVDEDQVEESVEAVRMQQAVAGSVEAELVALNALVCAAQGLPTVQAGRNPMRPEAWVRCLRNVVHDTPVPQPVRTRWLQYFGDELGAELARCYRDLAALLRQAGTSQAGFQIIPGAAGAMPRGAPQGLPQAHGGFGHPLPPATLPVAQARADVQAPTLLTVRALKRLLAGELDGAAGPGQAAPTTRSPLAPETQDPATVPAALEAMQDMREVDAVVRRLREREAGGKFGSAAYREALLREVHRPGQALSLHVVSLMVESMAGDPRLLAPVAQAVRDLEPALLRLALLDPRFFSNARHPARRLLDEVTSRSLAWPSEADPGFAAFMEPVREAVDALIATQVTGSEPYAFALQVLDEAWSRSQSRERRKRDKAVRSLMRAEQRNLLAVRVGRELSARADVAQAPGEVAAFLRGPWPHVIAQAQLDAKEGEADPGGYRAAVPELLWSVQPHTSTASAARLARELPHLLATLEAGLRGIGYAQVQVRRFFDRLHELQQDALKGIAPQPAAPAAANEVLSRLLGPVLADEGTWLAPAEAQQSGFLESVEGIGQPAFEATQDARRVAEAEAAAAAGPLPLPLGSWVDMQVGDGWSRWQLSWASPHGTLWMFTDASGDTHTMRPGLATQMLARGQLRIVSGEHVMDDALDAVADAALRNSAGFRP